MTVSFGSADHSTLLSADINGTFTSAAEILIIDDEILETEEGIGLFLFGDGASALGDELDINIVDDEGALCIARNMCIVYWTQSRSLAIAMMSDNNYTFLIEPMHIHNFLYFPMVIFTICNLTIAFWQGLCAFTNTNLGLAILLLRIDQPSAKFTCLMLDSSRYNSCESHNYFFVIRAFNFRTFI